MFQSTDILTLLTLLWEMGPVPLCVYMWEHDVIVEVICFAGTVACLLSNANICQIMSVCVGIANVLTALK